MDYATLVKNWMDVCHQVKRYQGVDGSQIDAFFSRLQPQAMSNGFLMLTADTSFIKNWVQQHFLDSIQRALTDLYGIPFTVLIEQDISSTPYPIDQLEDPKKDKTSFQSEDKCYPTDLSHRKNFQGSEPTIKESNPWLTEDEFSEEENLEIGCEFFDEGDESYWKTKEAPFLPSASLALEGEETRASSLTFESFVIGDSNRMAYSMAVSVAEAPGKSPLNPLFIYGKSGLGKTHLLRAIQNYIFETQPSLKVIYIDSMELLSDYMEASLAHDKEKSSYKRFKDRYEQADVLLIDDIQNLQGKKQTLEMVFQIFKKLIERGKQFVLSADRAPKNIDIDERYYTRFGSGGVIDIQPPEIETKLSIVKLFINEYKLSENPPQLTIPEDIQLYIAENSSSNIRELKSAVNKVILHINYFNLPRISITEVKTLLEDIFTGGASKNLTVDDIQKVIENYYRIRHSDLVGKSRTRNIAYPRHIAIYLCRQILDYPFNTIAKKFNRDHSTAMHSVSTVEKLLRDNREVQEEVEILKQEIRNL